MGEAEYYRLLNAVSAAIAVEPLPNLPCEDDDHLVVPAPANDNDGAWPHFAFPDGWTASC
ncbi:hypothetical protein X566_14895 [Afipia sp. P52-10]|jgi:hypothetical protein|uniref:hypothetical protein n=1 Tax=Afipia sp. P52-10 TaxID=1429916 RepID=UPI0003DF24D4|nr:hypothetical protein [Afipia sp. P52-10]ETR78793.1 hypothetical protein X566_14895 [Afipia sp. P52-10]